MDPVSCALEVVGAITARAEQATSNKEDCHLLANLAAQTTPVLQQLQQRPIEDKILLDGLDQLTDALKGAESAVTTCCQATYLVSLFSASKHARILKDAATKLEFALNQLPVASIGLTTDMHECLVTLKQELRDAQFRDSAALSRQTQYLREEMERNFHNHNQSPDQMRQMLRDVLKEHSSSEDWSKDLEILKKYAQEAKTNKEAQEEYEIQQLIETIEESTRAAQEPDIDFEKHLQCPIGCEIMTDPVILKDSGITYDRANIETWLNRGHRKDPSTQMEIRSGELIPNVLVKGLASLYLDGQEKTNGTGSGAAAAEMAEEPQRYLVPGLYEGRGRVEWRHGLASFAYVLLVIEPDGNIQGYTHQEAVHVKDPSGCWMITSGHWDRNRTDHSFLDDFYTHTGTLTAAPGMQRSVFDWKGQMALKDDPKEESIKADFHYKHLAPPPLLYHYLTCPGLLEMEGVITSPDGTDYPNKIVFLMIKDTTLRGWISMEVESSKEALTYGHALDGHWDLAGAMNFSIYFAEPGGEPIDSANAPTNFIAGFKLVGEIEDEQDTGLPVFSGFCRKIANKSPKEGPFPAITAKKPGTFEYRYFRKPSIPEPRRRRRVLKLLKIPADELMPTGTFTIAAYYDIDGTGNEEYFLCVGQGKDTDEREPLGRFCVWKNTPTAATPWKIEKATDRPGFCLSASDQMDKQDASMCGYLSVLATTDFEKSKGYDTNYLSIDPLSEEGEPCAWTVKRYNVEFVLTLTLGSEIASVGGANWVIAEPTGKHRRDDVSVYAPASRDPDDASRVHLKPV